MKVAFYWGASCGGCEIAVLDMNERILELVKHVEIVFWPVAMDVKYNDVEAMPDGHIDVTFFNGSIRNSEQEHMAKLLRVKSKTLMPRASWNWSTKAMTLLRTQARSRPRAPK
jgi:F420-non-reducing hydrogenase small subunit